MTGVLDTIDAEGFAGWLDENGVGAGPVEDLSPMAGGTQNALLGFRRGGTRYVLRRPPRHDEIGSRTTSRETAVLAALAGSAVPHPTLVAACADPSVIGATFYVMREVEGFNVLVDLVEPYLSDVMLQRTMGEALVDAVAELARFDVVEAGLAEPAPAEPWVQSQVRRWIRRLEGYLRLPGYDRVELAGLDSVTTWLERNQPRTSRLGLVHGDVHIGNVLFGRDGKVSALLDWELSQVGDPLLDLGQLLAWWPDAHGRHPSVRLAGFPGHDEAVERYLQRVGRPADDIPWFRVLACLRLAVLLEGTYARSRGGGASALLGERFHVLAGELIGQARAVASSQGRST